MRQSRESKKVTRPPPEDQASPSHAERRTRAIEDIAESLVRIRASIADISIWIAHIGRNTPGGRNS